MSRRSPLLLVGAACAAVATLAHAAPAEAQTHLTTGDWRQTSRPSQREADTVPQHWAFELRFGPYYPQVDEEFSSATPYESVFDNDPQFYLGLELDWQAVRIPYVGALGPGIGWGYTRTSAKAKITGCTVTETDSCESGQDTSLTILPMHLSAVLRLDELMRRTGFPVVPYGKFGVAFATWSAGSDSNVTDADGDEVLARDTTWGIHMAVGGMLSLRFLEPRSSANLYESTGIHHLYLFGEWMNASLDGLGSRPQMHVGTSTWVAGLAADF